MQSIDKLHGENHYATMLLLYGPKVQIKLIRKFEMKRGYRQNVHTSPYLAKSWLNLVLRDKMHIAWEIKGVKWVLEKMLIHNETKNFFLS